MESDLTALFRAHWPDIERPHEFEQQLRLTFPGINLLIELRKAILWEQTARAKKRLHARFFSNWLRRCLAARVVSGSTGGPGWPATSQNSSNSVSRSGAQETQLMFSRWESQAKDITPRKEAAARAAEIRRSLK
jgi:hypothetical protein